MGKSWHNFPDVWWTNLYFLFDKLKQDPNNKRRSNNAGDWLESAAQTEDDGCEGPPVLPASLGRTVWLAGSSSPYSTSARVNTKHSQHWTHWDQSHTLRSKHLESLPEIGDFWHEAEVLQFQLTIKIFPVFWALYSVRSGQFFSVLSSGGGWSQAPSLWCWGEAGGAEVCLQQCPACLQCQMVTTKQLCQYLRTLF